MDANLKDFTIEGRNESFRIKTITPIEGLGIMPQLKRMDDDINAANNFYRFAFEHVEVKVGEKWFPVLTKGTDTYMPAGIEEDWPKLLEISVKVARYLFENFTKSRK